MTTMSRQCAHLQSFKTIVIKLEEELRSHKQLIVSTDSQRDRGPTLTFAFDICQAKNLIMISSNTRKLTVYLN